MLPRYLPTMSVVYPRLWLMGGMVHVILCSGGGEPKGPRMLLFSSFSL